MAKSFLRSGNLDALLALGENGQPVYASALQLRETLRLKKQSDIASCLAIPQPDERGERIDWYAPFCGKVKSWVAASDSERAAAIQLLDSYQTAVDEIGQQAQRSQNPAMRLFGILLSKAFQFPDQNTIYLVDGKPVITFWGFVDVDKKPRADALDCLRATLQLTPPPQLPVNAPPLSAVSLPAAEPEPLIVTPPLKPRRLWRLAGWLLLPLIIAAALAGLYFSAFQIVQEPVIKTAKPAAEPPVTPVTAPVTAPVAVTAASAEPARLPEAPKITKPAQPQSEKPRDAVAETPARLATADDLVMPADAVKLGSTDFLNGSWRVTLEANNLPTGKPPSLKYQIRKGTGSARLIQGDGIRCKADISAGLMSSGNLVINSRYTARCSDGSRYKMPEIVCKAASGAASCEARYGTETVFPMTMKRETK